MNVKIFSFEKSRKFKKFQGHTLVEIMVAIIVLSIVMAIFTPLITKKLRTTTQSVAAESVGVRSNCSTYNEKCILCDSERCIRCNANCTAGQFIDFEDCTCKTCIAGCVYCKDDTTCEKCNVGYEKNASNICVPCTAGHYSDDGFTCVECSAGQAQSETGKSYCNVCEAGTFSKEAGSQNCVTCPAGEYNTSAGSTTCIKCEVDNYCTGGSHHAACDPGYGADEGSSSCVACSTKIDANCEECLNQSECTACKINYYINSSKTCSKCPAGKSCNGTATTQTCAAGTYSPEGVASCSVCADGTYSAAGASSCTSCTSLDAFCSVCNKATGACTTCQAGYALSGGSCVLDKFSFTFSGTHEPSSSSYNGSHSILLKSNGTFVPKTNAIVTIVVVGGGGAGGPVHGGGGGGGCVSQHVDVTLNKDENYTVVIGAGGTGSDRFQSDETVRNGGTTKFGTYQAVGGKGGGSIADGRLDGWNCASKDYSGGAAGCAGSGAGGATSNASSGQQAGGSGVEVEFLSATGSTAYFAGGGGGGGYISGSGKAGGNGGGGKGGSGWSKSNTNDVEDGVANTGGGGGGAGEVFGQCGTNVCWKSSQTNQWCSRQSGNGGSGVVIITPKHN